MLLIRETEDGAFRYNQSANVRQAMNLYTQALGTLDAHILQGVG